METDLYSFAFRGILAEEALDKAGHKKYTAEEAFFSESLAKELHFDEIDSKYVEQSKTMITVFATITAFENATREFCFLNTCWGIWRRLVGKRCTKRY